MVVERGKCGNGRGRRNAMGRCGNGWGMCGNVTGVCGNAWGWELFPW